MEYIHKSVLLNEAIENLHLKEDGIYVDATLGGAGHSKEILKRIPKGHLYGFDQDDYALERSKKVLDEVGSNHTLIKSNFTNLKEELNKLNVNKIDGILYDLGVSSFQFDIPERGFSYNYDAKLDMRMDTSKSFSAYNVINEYSYEALAEVFYKYAEEPFSRPIAKKICEARGKKPIETTFELVDVIKSALPQKVLNKKGHPAKRVFQALRIEVNDELKVFEDSLNQAFDLMNKDGYIVVITFHSLEDRICKTMFKRASTVEEIEGLPMMSGKEAPFELITRHPITSTEEELEYNNRAHSAKMRVLRKK